MSADGKSAGTISLAKEKGAYCTFPVTTTHGPRDKSAYHGREDSRRMIAVVRRFPVLSQTKGK
jgi:hypothetical protein